jgi:hypothetical protein
MRKVGWGVAVTAMVLGGAARARAEEPGAATPPAQAAPATPATPVAPSAPSAPSAPTPAVSPPCPPSVDLAEEQRAFNREMELFVRRWEVTQRLVAEREARAFAEAEARYVKLAALTKKLAEDAAAEAERQFDAAVTLFMKKRELTQALVAPPAPAPAATPPSGRALERGYDLDYVR